MRKRKERHEEVLMETPPLGVNPQIYLKSCDSLMS